MRTSAATRLPGPPAEEPRSVGRGQPRWGRSLTLVVALAALAVAGGASASEASPASTHQAGVVTLRHASNNFRVKAPRNYRLSVRGGVYTIAGPQVKVTVRVLRVRRGARAVGLRRLAQIPGRVVLRKGGARVFVAMKDRGGTRSALRVVRRGPSLVATTSVYPRGRPGLARVAQRIAASVRVRAAARGPQLRPGAPGPGASPGPGPSPGPSPSPGAPRPGAPPGPPAAPQRVLVPLIPYQAPDGGLTAWVPSDPDWTISSRGGSLEGSSPRGFFLIGRDNQILLPGAFTAPGAEVLLAHPFVNAADALRLVVPLISQRAGVNLTDVRIRQVLLEPTLPGFNSSAMFLYDFQLNGQPWVGVSNVGTSDLGGSTFQWQLSTSTIAVPAGGDPTVGAALLLVYRSYNPAGAIAASNARSRQVLSDINGIWQGVTEFRSRIADQQSRDVSCLLRTGPSVIDDGARELGLPPLDDCESFYHPRPA